MNVGHLPRLFVALLVVVPVSPSSARAQSDDERAPVSLSLDACPITEFTDASDATAIAQACAAVALTSVGIELGGSDETALGKTVLSCHGLYADYVCDAALDACGQ